MRTRHVLLAVVVTAIWGINFSVIKIGLESVDPFLLAGVRFALCAFPAVLFVRRPAVPWRYLAGYGLVFGVGLWGVVNLGVEAGLSAGLASLVLQLSAFLTIFLGAAVFRERLTRNQLYGTAVALSGLACVFFLTDGSVSAAGIALVVLGAFSWSTANVLLKKAAPDDVLAFLVWSCVFSPVPLFLLDLAVHGTSGYTGLASALDLTAVASILFQAYPTTLFAYGVWNWLLKEYPVSTVAPLSLLVPVFGVLGSVVIFDEALPALKVVSGLLIVLGLVISLYGTRLTAALRNSLQEAEA
ncbi:EamA family transporter [Streptomyces sp. SID13726]|uniref:EamA family transporter n=1 Tax=Streptomyces sp. SID13726 TaxID=2706058 RepID=UPI0013BBA521|nr:EamA family transporter [Streptomyces sp. SID13726]NEB00230.1 EamA family transporter [Streptomyces sp. SID13726]